MTVPAHRPITLNGWRDRSIAAAPFLGVAALLAINPADDGPTLCPIALITGVACPGCGMTRAASALIRGDVVLALDYHPLIPLVALLLTASWAWFLLRRAGKVGPISNRLVNLVLLGTGVSLVAVWILRAVTGTLPPV
ncbi:MAG TPA: DUF2752 domain-containing protein [Acidimicrobiia bacterium]|nr:DUF2752 domain-containing protein [Acidimicrobiia bacterium]